MEITQSTTYRATFVLVDATDDETAETGITPTVYVSKNGGAFATSTNAAVEIGRGRYYVDLTTTETNTVGELCIDAEGTGTDVYRSVYQVESNSSASVTLSASQMNAIADHVTRRDAANIEASGDGDTVSQHSLLGALLKMAGRARIDGVADELVVYKANETTEFYRQAVTVDATADPIVEVA